MARSAKIPMVDGRHHGAADHPGPAARGTGIAAARSGQQRHTRTGFAEVRDGRFWASSINFPTEGCWQITGTAGPASLTFVVLKARS